ncbi:MULTISPECIES: hypothetical protein [unclassified Microcoleus]
MVDCPRIFFWKEEALRRKREEGRGKFGNEQCTGCNGCNGCKSVGRRKREEGIRRKREEGRGKKEEGRRKREDTRRHPKLEARS